MSSENRRIVFAVVFALALCWAVNEWVKWLNQPPKPSMEDVIACEKTDPASFLPKQNMTNGEAAKLIEEGRAAQERCQRAVIYIKERMGNEQ